MGGAGNETSDDENFEKSREKSTAQSICGFTIYIKKDQPLITRKRIRN